MNFAQFVKSGERNAWIREPGLDLYVRIVLPRHREEWGVDFDLANMNATKPGKGALTRFLAKYESQYGFRVESVLNKRLVKYLERRGYAHVGTTEVPVMVRRKS